MGRKYQSNFIEFGDRERESIYSGLFIWIIFFFAANFQIANIMGFITAALYLNLRDEQQTLKGQPYLRRIFTPIDSKNIRCRICSTNCSNYAR